MVTTRSAAVEVERCSVPGCGSVIDGYGHNATPLGPGRACETCLPTVIMARLAAIVGKKSRLQEP